MVIAAAKQEFCVMSIGVEKYLDKFEASIELVEDEVQNLEERQKIKMVYEDINDTNLLDLMKEVQYDRLLIFCNNLAFNLGTIKRSSICFGKMMDELALESKEVIVISSVELNYLKQYLQQTILLDTTWMSDLTAYVYSNIQSTDI
eukprot:TRINITY_DN3388_c1_g1_i2.p4 TRINITY_DN3388_c1_g1~~TRINITY_DN3388_c1_g1_i2.p4  ORF type:complete len:146 (+),score=17.98 TRINITY_DN3388_c1_g1_i2:157-594(+)